jgi:cell wall-associated NlpC family hydrolase
MIIKKLFTALFIAAALTTTAVAAELAIGTVDASALNMRASDSTSSPVITTAKRGEKVIILDRNGDWYKVYFNDKEGYMHAGYLVRSESADISGFSISGVVTGSVVNVRSRPGTSNPVLCQLRKGTVASVLGTESGWYRIEYGSHTGYIHPDYFTVKEVKSKTGTAASGSAPVEDPSSPASEVSGSDVSDIRLSVVEFAKKYLGVKYRSGGRSPSTGFDCSGFVYYVFRNFGYTLNPGASNQMDKVSLISKSELLPGDLVFFNTGSSRRASHVGIYIGDNKFIHAVSPGKSVAISSLSESYYSKYYVGSGRVLS